MILKIGVNRKGKPPPSCLHAGSEGLGAFEKTSTGCVDGFGQLNCAKAPIEILLALSTKLHSSQTLSRFQTGVH